MSWARCLSGRQLRAIAVRALAVGLFFLPPFLWGLWRNVTFGRAIGTALDGPVLHVELQPNTDWPRQRLTDPEKITALRAWVLATDEDSPVRSAPPVCVCELRFVFLDGREAVIQHSPFREPRGEHGYTDYERDVRLYFAGHWRTGPREALIELFDLPEPADSRR